MFHQEGWVCCAPWADRGAAGKVEVRVRRWLKYGPGEAGRDVEGGRVLCAGLPLHAIEITGDGANMEDYRNITYPISKPFYGHENSGV